MIKRANNELKYSLAVFVPLCLLFAIKLPLVVSDYPLQTSSYYALNYSAGFIPRGLIGTILWLLNGYVGTTEILVFSAACAGVLAVLTSIYLGRLLARCEADGKCFDAAKIFVIFFVASPFSASFFFQQLHLGRLEFYGLLLMLISLSLMKRRFLCWLIPVLCLAAMVIYQGFIFLYMPVIAVPLLYLLIKSRFSGRYIALCTVTYGALIASFFCLQFPSLMPFAKAEFADAEAMVEYFSQFTDINIDIVKYYTLSFIDLGELYEKMSKPHILSFLPYYIPAVVAVTAPFAAFYFTVWRRSFSGADARGKFFFLVCIFVPLVAAPSFILGMDSDRWVAAVFISQAVIFFFLLWERDEAVTEQSVRIANALKKRPMLFLALAAMIVATSLSELPIMCYTRADFSFYNEYFESAGMLDEISRIMSETT